MIELPVTSPVLTAQEACVYLRLCEPDAPGEEIERAVRTLQRHVREGRLRPLKTGNAYTFWLAELERFVRDETAQFVPERRPVREGDKRLKDSQSLGRRPKNPVRSIKNGVSGASRA